MLRQPEDPWHIYEADFPILGTVSQKLKFLVNYAILAPSNHNTQPWLFRLTDDVLELYADRTRALPVVDPEDRELTISCGAALFNVIVAARHFGYREVVEELPEGSFDLLASVRLSRRESASSDEHLLFHAIMMRRTNRLPFQSRPIPQTLLTELEAAASHEGAWLHLMADEDKRNLVGELIARGDHIQMADVRFRRELASWIHPNRASTRDGLPGYALGFGDIMSYVGPLVVRTFDMGKGKAARDRELAAGSPMLAVLGTNSDKPPAWLSAGRALQRVLLRARTDDVWASFLNQPIEVSELRPQLSQLIDRTGFPQILLRMGYGSYVQPAPRRLAGHVILSDLGP